MTSRRRTFLAVAGSGLAGLAGCLADTESGASEDTQTPDQTPGGAVETGSTPTGSRALSAAVSVSTVSYAVSAVPAADRRGLVVGGNAPKSLSAFPAPLADAIRQAHADGFRTDSVDDSLLAAVDEARERPYHELSEVYVRLDGRSYVAELGLPRLGVQLAERTIEEYDADRVVSHETEFESDAVDRLLSQVAWDGSPEKARSSYWQSLVDEDVASFLDRYDYVEDYRGVSPIQAERRDWEPPYAVDLREMTPADRWGREVFALQSFDDELQTLVRTAVDRGGEGLAPPFLTDTVPPSAVDLMARDDRPLVQVDGTTYVFGVTEGTHDRIPIVVEVESGPSTESGLARFGLRVAVTDEKPDAAVAAGERVSLFSQVGLPTALWVLDDGEQHLLDSDSYELDVTSGPDGESWSLDADGESLGETTVSREFSVGDTLSAAYTVPRTVSPGSYSLPATVAAVWREESGDRERASGVYPFTIDLDLTES